MDDIAYSNIFIKLNDPTDIAVSLAIQDELTEAILPYSYFFFVTDNVKAKKNLELMTSLMNMIFDGTIAIMMFLCFFSLSASMSANLLE